MIIALEFVQSKTFIFLSCSQMCELILLKKKKKKKKSAAGPARIL